MVSQGTKVAEVTLAVTGLAIHFDAEEVFNAGELGREPSAGSTVCWMGNGARGFNQQKPRCVLTCWDDSHGE